MSEIILRVENLRKEYGEVVPIKNISFEVRRGEVISIIGGSGTGKSTFLRMINLMERPTAGKIIFADENIAATGYNLSLVRQKIGMIYEEGTPAQIFDAPKKPKTAAFIRRQKYFHYEIRSRNFDLPEIQGKIMTFAYKYGLGEKYSQRLQLCCEEIIFEMLSHCYEEPDEIFMTVDIIYTETKRLLELNLSCGGKKYNPFEKKSSADNTEDLSLKILYGYGKNFSHSYYDDENKVCMEITPPK